MDVLQIEAQARETGKGAARAVRRQKNVPCVLYGPAVDPVVFQVPEQTLMPLIYTNESHVVRIELNGDAWECILKDMAFHPVTDRPMHADFQVLQTGEMITMTIPVNYQGVPQGQTAGGNTQYNVQQLDVRCLPKNIPASIDVDVTHLDIGDALHISDLSVEGVEFMDAPERTLVTVIQPRAVVEEEAEEGLEPATEAEIAEEGDVTDTAEGEAPDAT